VDIRERSTTLEGVYAYSRFPQPVTLGAVTADGGVMTVFANVVTANYFTVLGAVPAAGRLLRPADSEIPGESPVVVLSHRCWKRGFNSDPGIIGRSVTVNGQPFTVVGVASQNFRGTGFRAVDVWMPMSTVATVMPRGADLLTDRAAERLLLGGRLKPNASIGQAGAEMDTIGKALEHDFTEQNRNLRLQLAASSPTPGSRGPVVAFLALLVVIVALVLAVACANVGGLLLARASARRKEMAVRLAMGAGRSRLIRQLLTESLLLFVLGGAAGLLLARGLTSIVAALLPALPFPVDLSLAVDTRVIAFTGGISCIAALLCGLAPALQSSKPELTVALKNEPGLVGRVRLRYAFVVAQVTFSVVLVIVAGLFVRALQRAATIDPGFNSHGVELASIDVAQAGYTLATGPVFTQEMVDRLRALPDIQSVTVASGAPGGVEVRRETVDVPAERGGDSSSGGTFAADWTIVAPGYFAALQTPLVAGRDFTAADRAGSQAVAIVSEAAARKFWPGQDALGKRLLVSSGATPGTRTASQSMLVVGVAHDMQLTTLIDGQGRPSVYVPLDQHYQTSLTIIARTTHGQRVAEPIRSLLRSMNPNLALITSQTLDESVALGLTPQRIAASVSGTLGIVGLLLAGVGNYGLTAYMVTRRTREIGIRIALGAPRANVVRMIVREALGLTLTGSAIGFVFAALISQVLAGFLYGIPPVDPVTFGGTTLLFVAVGLIACYRPLRRATVIDPTQALRYE
jgi:predicted permease